MSISANFISCTGCDFKGVIQYRPLTLVYNFPDGFCVETGRTFGWCAECEKIKDIEPIFDVCEIKSNIAALEVMDRSPRSFVWNAIDRILGGSGGKVDNEELANLQGLLRIAEMRRSKPRCLTCGSDRTQQITFNAQCLSENFIHKCGGRFRIEPKDHEAPRFSYRPETIFLDTEGRRLDMLVKQQEHESVHNQQANVGFDYEQEKLLALTYPRSIDSLKHLIIISEACAEAYPRGGKYFDAAIEQLMAAVGACVRGLVQDGYVENSNDLKLALEALDLAMWRCEYVYNSHKPKAFQFWKAWFSRLQKNFDAS